jgi:small subunit ribosomal protein S20
MHDRRHETGDTNSVKEPGLPTMANIKSQKKRNLTNAKRHERNKAVRAELKTRIKTAEAVSPDDDSGAALRAAIKRIDMAASKGVIHKNTAARMKSRLVKNVQGASAA